MMDTNIAVPEYVARRQAIARALKGGTGVLFAGDAAASLHDAFKADSAFYYATGIGGEAGAAVLFDPTNPDPNRRCCLFLKPRNPEVEQWDGWRSPLSAALRKETGFTRIFRSNALPMMLTDALRRSKKACCLHKFSTFDAPVSADLAAFRKVAERVPGVSISDETMIVPRMRSTKSRAEVRLVARALDCTRAGYDAMLTELAPGVNEQRLHRLLERGFADSGGTGNAYHPIVGAGLNSTVLHYHANDQELADGDLLCVDAAAAFGGYASDITRTFPVSGKFTKEQRRVYDVVLAAQEAAIRAVRPGAMMHQVDAAARDVIEKAGFGDAFMHGIGHHLGLDVHDATPDGALKPGAIVTIEPGVYLTDRKLGIRIEDDILVTTSGRKNLSSSIPKTADDVEKWIAARRRAKR